MPKQMVMLSKALSKACTDGNYTFINSCIAVPAHLKDGYYSVNTEDIISAYQLIAEPLSDALLDNISMFGTWEFQRGEVTLI